MKGKLIILIHLLLLLSNLGNKNLLHSGKVIYNAPKKIPSSWNQKSLEYKDVNSKNDRFILITKDNLSSIKKELKKEASGLITLTGERKLTYEDQLKINKNEVIIYVTLGQCSSGGYAINIEEIRKKNNHLIVIVDRHLPKEWVTFGATIPYDLVKINKKHLEDIKEIIFLTEEGLKLEIIKYIEKN